VACAILALDASAVASGSLSQAGTPAPEPLRFVRESGREADAFQSPERALELGGTEWWLRTRQIFSDFTLHLEFALRSAGSEAGVGLRTVHSGTRWPVSGYRLLMAAGRQPELRAPDEPLDPVGGSHDAPRLTAGVWHELTVTAAGSTLSIVLDDVKLADYDVDVFTGAVFVESRKGPVAFRHLSVVPSPPSSIVKVSDFREDTRLLHPRLANGSPPNYTPAAMQRGAAGVVALEAVVEIDGTVGPVTLTRLVDPDLEHAALAALRRWQFKPALLDGKPVRSLIEVEMAFALQR
jgi:TonB family protein